MKTKNIVLTGMFAALMTVISQISIPMPSGIPITIQSLGITIIGIVLGWKLGLTSVLIYILLGAIGLPVFANFKGGLSHLFNITGGYILGWPIMVIFCGIRYKNHNKKIEYIITILLAIIGLLFDELIGAIQWAALSDNKNLTMILSYSIIAFIPKDIFISILAVIVGLQIRTRLKKSQLIIT